MTNMLKKVFNWSEVHLSEMTCYKIHTLDTLLSSRARLVLKKKNFVVKQHIIDARTRQAGAGMK